MKYTIEGFSQEKLVEFGMDVNDAIILRWFIDFKDSGKMATEIVNNDKYYWINYEELLKDLPIMNIKKDTLYRRLKKMESVQILKHFTKKQGGTYSMYTLGSNYCKLVDFNELGFKSEGLGNKSVEGTESNPKGTDYNPEQKTHLLNQSTKEINLLNKTEITEEPVPVLSKKDKIKAVLKIEKVELDSNFITELANKYSFEEIVDYIRLIPKDAENQGAYLRGILKKSGVQTKKLKEIQKPIETPIVQEPKEKPLRDDYITKFLAGRKLSDLPLWDRKILNRTLEGWGYEGTE